MKASCFHIQLDKPKVSLATASTRGDLNASVCHMVNVERRLGFSPDHHLPALVYCRYIENNPIH